MKATEAIDLARAAWSCRGNGTALIVRAHLTSPVVCDTLAHLQQLDAALEWAALYAVAGDPQSLLWPTSGIGLLPSPLAVVERAGWQIACCSAPRVMGARESVRKRRRRTDAEHLGIKGRVVTGGGAYKCLDMPMLTVIAPVIEWSVRADRERLRSLLAQLHSLGRNAGAGMGEVAGWELLDDFRDASLERDGKPARPIPVASCEEACKRYGNDVEIAEVGVRGPYWSRRNRTLAAVPC